MPPTERNGRVHTSTVTVAVITENKSLFKLNMNDVETKYCRSQGNGGQNINKVNTCVVLTHLPTGIQAKCQETRHQHKNEEIAWKKLKEHLLEIHNKGQVSTENLDRKNQVGSGMRGDKRRTYQVKHNIVTDHVTGKRTDMNSIYKGEIQKLHP